MSNLRPALSWNYWTRVNEPPRTGEWFVARAGSEVRIVHFVDKNDRLPVDHSGKMWATAPMLWAPLAEFISHYSHYTYKQDVSEQELTPLAQAKLNALIAIQRLEEISELSMQQFEDQVGDVPEAARINDDEFKRIRKWAEAWLQ